MIVVYLSVGFQIVISALGLFYSAWVCDQARKDRQLFTDADPKDIVITAQIRLRNSFGILLCIFAFLTSGASVLSLAVYADTSKDYALSFRWAILITSLRSIAVQLVLLYLSYYNMYYRKLLSQMKVENSLREIAIIEEVPK